MTSESRKRWIVANRDDLLAKRRARYAKNRKSDPEKFRAERRKYNKPPKNTNERRRATMRSLLWQVLTGKVKSGYMVDLLGCTHEEAIAHIEIQFQPGWTWSDYGKLFEIDHIKPCREFDLSDPAQQRVCFHYTNLRPREKSANRAWRREAA